MAIAVAPHVAIRSLNAYLGVAKPRTILPHLISAAAAMFLAAQGPPPTSALLFTLMGGACVAAAANILNSYLDRDIDALMDRTQRRPLPAGQLKPHDGLSLAIAIGLVGVTMLGRSVNPVAAALAMAALGYYVFPYTLWLKRNTWWSTVACSGVGAFPPLVGWAAVTHRIELTPFLLGAIIALWTVPHFWTLAVFRRNDYERASLRVLPDKGVASWIIVCSLLLVAASLLLVPVARLGLLYLATAAPLGIGFLYLGFRINQQESLRTAARFHAYSILYLVVLFGSMIIDRALV